MYDHSYPLYLQLTKARRSVMANSFEDFLGSFTLESPDFKRALKILIKYEIHVLVSRTISTYMY